MRILRPTLFIQSKLQPTLYIITTQQAATHPIHILYTQNMYE